MKTAKKIDQGQYLRKSNNRWKWMAGATAATAAGVSASQAGTITINLVDNLLSTIGTNGNSLNADLTGDGHPDLTIADAVAGYNYATVTLNGVRALCRNRYSVAATYVYYGFVQLGLRHATYLYFKTIHYSTRTSGTRSLMGSIPMFFKDLHINGGAPYRGFAASNRDSQQDPAR